MSNSSRLLQFCSETISIFIADNINLLLSGFDIRIATHSMCIFTNLCELMITDASLQRNRKSIQKLKSLVRLDLSYDSSVMLISMYYLFTTLMRYWNIHIPALFFLFWAEMVLDPTQPTSMCMVSTWLSINRLSTASHQIVLHLLQQFEICRME